MYPNGTVVLYKEIDLTITCQFDYTNIPTDFHTCETVAYMQNEFTDTGMLRWVDKFNENRKHQFMTWDIQMQYDEDVSIRWKSVPDGLGSGLKFSFSFKRDSYFLGKLFINPSIIFVILAYSSFWIDKNEAAARVSLVITNILNAISLIVSTNGYIPNVPYKTWLQDFLMWNLFFTVLPMVQYAILNSSTVTYTYRKKLI